MAVIAEILIDLRTAGLLTAGLLAGALPDVTSGQLRHLHIQTNLQDN